MKQFRMLTVCALIIMSLPVATSALSADDVQAKIRELLSKVAELTSQINALKTQLPAPEIMPSVSSINHRVCSILNRRLAEGASGDDVRGLQEFLNTEGFLSSAPTGYFGQLTREALKTWQAQQGVVASGDARTTGWGALGPKTIERIKIWCGGSQQFSASPRRGAAPLPVTFSTWLSGFRVPNISYVIDFGDGTSEEAADCNAPADACISPGLNTHTYGSDGTYTATLIKIMDPCMGNIACKAAVQRENVGKLQIVVGSTACTKEYRPVCGLKQIVCITTPCNPIPQTYSNKCMMENDGATFSYEGQCRDTNEDPSTNPKCKAWFDGCNSCSRAESGGPAMCTLKACVAGAMARPYCTAYFGTTGNKAPNISGFSGPTTLKTNETGTWTVKASDPENQPLSYYISWGDESVVANAGVMTSLPVFTQSTSFTHVYSKAGTYAVSIIARDSEGVEARVTISVQVTAETVACTLQYDPICGRPAGCANTCSPGMMCTMECRLPDPLTYSNRCFLEAAGASEIHVGACESTDSQDPAQNPQCKKWTDGLYCGKTCTRTSLGGAPQCYSASCLAYGPSNPIPRCTEYFGEQ